jgi:hypothetical protein
MMAPSDHAPDRYGLLPSLRRKFRLGGGCDSCDGCGGKHGLGGHFAGKGGHGGGYGGGYGDPNAQQQPMMMQGTLVFPHHPYVRSPRDFFMYEPGR